MAVKKYELVKDDVKVIAPGRMVFGSAWVSDAARVFGNAWIHGNACVLGRAIVFGNAFARCLEQDYLGV